LDLQSLTIDRGRTPAPTRAPRARRRPWLWRAAALAAVGAVAVVFWPALRALADRFNLPQVRTLLVVESAPAAAAAVRGTAANGYIVAARRAALSSDVPGRIVEMNVTEGSVVQKGFVVARLYSDEYRAAMQRAEADVVAAAAGVERAEASRAAAEAAARESASAVVTARAQRDEAAASQRWADAELLRVDDLVRSGIGSPRDRDKAQSELDAAAARTAAMAAAAATAEQAAATAQQRLGVAATDVAVARAQRDVAVAARDLAQATLDKTDVRAPFDGIVVLKDAEIGEVVSPNVQGGSTARGAICTLVDFDSLEAQANVPETTLASVRLGAPADVFLDGYPDDRYPGTVDRIWPTADRQKATVEVRVKLLRKDERLRPEMGVRVVFRTDEPDGAVAVDASAPKRTIVVPEGALVQHEGKDGAFVVERDVVRFAPVAAGERRSGRVAIDGGLSPGQRIVLDPPGSLRDGDRVRIVEQ
jgi:RND family efflux transporter MFP subunit